MRRVVFVFFASIFATSAAGQTGPWAPAAGLAAGRVSVVKSNDAKPSVVWAGGGGGVYVSTDAGASWTLKTAGLPDPQRLGVPNRVMDVDRRNPDVVFAAVGQNNAGWVLYRTSDRGSTWSAVNPPNASAPDILLTLDQASPGNFYFLWHGYDSVCWGSTTLRYGSCAYPFGGTLAVDPTNPDNLYAAEVKSTDGGKTWTYYGYGTVTFVRVDEAGAVWAGGNDGLRVRIAKSTDGGKTWTDLSAGLPAAGFSPSPLTVGEIAASPTNPSVLVAAVGPDYLTGDPNVVLPDGGFYRSIDGGAHWYRLGSHFESTTVAFAGANGETLVGGTTKNGVVTTDANPPAAAISIQGITPGSGSMDGGTLLMVYGSGFTPWTWVTVGGREATDFTFFDAETIRVRTPAHAVGFGDVVVHNADGGAAVLPGAFQFQDWAHPANYPLSSCDPTQGLCLENGRFSVSVLRPGFTATHAVPLSQKSGYFWFDFSPSVEVTVKILDGRTIDGHYWIHWSALTEEAFSLEVMDRLTMTPHVYEKPAGNAAAVIDKTTF